MASFLIPDEQPPRRVAPGYFPAPQPPARAVPGQFFAPEEQLPRPQRRGLDLQLFAISALVVFIIAPVATLTGVWVFIQIAHAIAGR